MTITRRAASRILANCLPDQEQAEKIRQWLDKHEAGSPDTPSLDDATATLLFAAAMDDSESWRALVARHTVLADLNDFDIFSALVRLTGGQP